MQIQTWQLLEFVLVCQLHVVFVCAQPGCQNPVPLDPMVGTRHQFHWDLLSHPETQSVPLAIKNMKKSCIFSVELLHFQKFLQLIYMRYEIKKVTLFHLPSLTACRREMKFWSVCLRTSVSSMLTWMTFLQHLAWGFREFMRFALECPLICLRKWAKRKQDRCRLAHHMLHE